ncbi:proton-conducting transporter transmembrane domain-containing protein [Geomesophilobacter sediminis]|uniref:proton-conducting transporter transmembrane domain-containing protein n=1 Tax=Geomesophilobacter sediminis TaxID=2798584 RepID=UPI001F1ACCBF|nr:proton-conducting transporter membrane subunit [Geomesophilobacter sediminis]
MALPAILAALLAGEHAAYLVRWTLPFGPCELLLDPLALFFLIPIFLVFPLGSLYANGYWPNASHPTTQPPVTFFYGLLAAAMALVVIARNGALFLMAWEVMALSGYFLLICEHRHREVRAAGTLYLIASHIGVAALFALFSLLASRVGSFVLPGAGALHLDPSAAFPFYLLALIGFGSKAGLMPLHIWLPSAHANAPSHVSALLSGVMLKMGIYGLLRVTTFFPERPLWLGAVLLSAGIVSAILGISLAAAQKDLKRLLAYSSIENLGIVAAALGSAFIGEATGNPRLAFLALTGGLFHILNHSLFKPLLFFSAGSVMHATGTRDLDLMGGLARKMPKSALLSAVGVVAICGLPPGNGFVSEFFIYLGWLSEATAPFPILALAAPLLALVGGIAVISFVKLFGAAFLGAPRSEGAEHGHESPASMLVPMGLLALLCLLGGVLPQGFLALTRPVLATLAPSAPGYRLPVSPLWFTAAALALLLLGSVIALFLKGRTAGHASHGPTWGCGYIAPTTRMEYTGTAFSGIFTTLWGGIVRTTVTGAKVTGFPPAPARVSYTPREIILERVVGPLFKLCDQGFSLLRRMQHGEVQVYILYIFVTLVLLLIWVR